jgi:hypothetical protein
MYGLLKSAVLGAALLTGMAVAAQAQSVSATPPAGAAPQQSVNPHPYGPKPGGGKAWKQEHYQNPPDYATNRAFHPYSMHGMGPQTDTPFFGSTPKGGVAQPASSGNAQAPKTN